MCYSTNYNSIKVTDKYYTPDESEYLATKECLRLWAIDEYSEYRMKFTLLILFYILCSVLNAQKLYKLNASDTLIEYPKDHYFLSDKLVWFDSTYVEQVKGGSRLKIGKICEEFGCKGDLDFTGENQSAWWLIENKILIVYTTLINYNEYVTTLKVWRYKKGKGFELIL